MHATRRNILLAATAMITSPILAQAVPSTKVAMEAVRNATADPMAVQFRNVTTRGTLVCGEYNAKNLLGAYVGFDRFVFEPSRNEGFLMKSMARISRSGVIESPDGIIRRVREGGGGVDPKAARQQMEKITSDASAMLLQCA